MGDIDQHLGWVLNQKPRKTVAFTGPQAALVVAVTPAGITFTIPAFGSDYAFGPAHWSRPAAGAGDPPPGTACLAVFVGGGVDQAWIVAFDHWPA